MNTLTSGYMTNTCRGLMLTAARACDVSPCQLLV